MQDQVKNSTSGKKEPQLFTMMPFPLDVLEVSGIDMGDIIRFTATDGKIIMEAVTDLTDYPCDGDCDTCPVSDVPCYGQCDECPCANGCRRRKGVQ